MTPSGRAAWLGVLSLILVLVCVPRFNRQDLGFLGALTSGGATATEEKGDAEFYETYVQVFRGEASRDALTTPFSYRPLVPLLAAPLPFGAMTALNLVNLVGLEIGMLFLFLILRRLGGSDPLALLGCALYAVSFPVFYYGSVGIVDPVLVGFVTAGTYCILADRLRWLVAVSLLGVLCKETVVVLLAPLFVHLWRARALGFVAALVLTGALGLGMAAVEVGVRLQVPGTAGHGWPMSLASLLENLQRPRAVLSFLLGLGVPGAAALLFAAGRASEVVRRPELATLAAGFLATLALSFYAMLAAYADGRFIWLSYPFSIPLAMVFAAQLREQRSRA